jgi:carbonic anhydrase
MPSRILPSLPRAVLGRVSLPPALHAPFSSSTAQACSSSSNRTATDRLATGLQKNKEWASNYPAQFPSLATGQQPEILWIGCSDSRCPETTILGLNPGDVFVHRNIANIVHQADLSSACVVEFAVSYLKVKHIVVSGHTACGGVNAALGNSKLGILDTWLLPLRNLRQQNLELLQSLEPKEAISKLAELNVIDGVQKLKQLGVVIDAIENRGLQVHGVVYDVATGLLRTLNAEDESHEATKARLTAFKTA